MIIHALTKAAQVRIEKHGDAWEQLDVSTDSCGDVTQYLLCSMKDDARYWWRHDEFEIEQVIK